MVLAAVGTVGIGATVEAAPPVSPLPTHYTVLPQDACAPQVVLLE